MEDQQTTGATRPTQGRVIALIVGLGLIIVGTVLTMAWGRPPEVPAIIPAAAAQPFNDPARPDGPHNGAETPVQVSLPESYRLNISFGDLGPQLQAAGAIDYDRFTQLYQQMGQPLTESQKAILTQGSDAPIIFDYQNAHFLLNFFWALGLTNRNVILTEGPMMQHSEGDIGGFASTGGWTLGHHPATQLYASTLIISLTPDQQSRLEEAANNIYRPCCNNHTAFADCNHGMAMLGLLELLASQDASIEELFAAAKAVNGFWFPQQALQTAVFFKTAMNLDYTDVDPRVAVSRDTFSGSGFAQVQQWLANNGLLQQSPGGDGSCEVS